MLRLLGFIEKVEGFLSGLSNRDFMRFEEKYIKIVMLTYFRLSNICIVKSEYEVKGGYVDIALLRRDSKVKYEVLLEIKYIKKSDLEKHSDRIVQKKLSEAKNQLNCYTQAEEFKDRNDLKKWAIVFAGPKTVVVEEV